MSGMYSVVMPSRPDEPFILEALRSIAEQTVPPERVIVVLNGPGAHESAHISQIGAAHPEVEVRALAEPGMASALSVGIGASTSPFVAVLDADDLWAPHKQERQLAVLEQDPGLDAVYCEAVNFHDVADGARVEGISAVTRMFSATTFRRDAFDRFGRPDAAVSHFAWLVRWWAAADRAGIRTSGLEYRGLWRRIHDANGWVTDRDAGRADLLGELRRISAARAAGRAAGELAVG